MRVRLCARIYVHNAQSVAVAATAAAATERKKKMLCIKLFLHYSVAATIGLFCYEPIKSNFNAKTFNATEN